ncbi:hypothetical protein EOD41_14425 [Mucilaginibacter limnophilus]|uniref:Uncharacterized protein n=1 Tax=Mucilaginibacter limnophilus TaxID=1932778 RepID=A0A3S2XZV1_9SPHI|nr:hypothetical protein [Mucilaginibacter limnophilus]RVU00152.1 hypothetical protein EOD41_14425 [Mucilaginibacter limnophilus]
MEIFVRYVSPLSVLLPIIAGLVYYKYLGTAQKIIFYYVLYSAFSNGTNIYMVRVLHKTSVIPFAVGSIGWVALISSFYAVVFKGNLSRAIYIITFLFSVFAVTNVLYIQTHHQFNTYTVTLNAIIVLVYAMIYVYRQNAVDIDASWGSNSLNWINTGFLLYYSTALMMYITFALITYEIANITFAIHNTALITMYVLFVIGFKKCKA